MPRPGGRRPQEKSKDFFGSMKRLIGNLKPWKFVMVFALCLAMISAILSLIAPNRLSSFTDTISEGLVPKTEKLEEVSNKILLQMNAENIQRKVGVILASEEIDKQDKEATKSAIEAMDKVSSEEGVKVFFSLPDTVLVYFFDPFIMDGETISSEDQVAFLSLFSKMNEDLNHDAMLSYLDELPDSIYSIVKPNIDMNKIKSIALFIGTIYLCSALFGYIQSFSMTTVSNSFAKSLRTKISKKINKLPLKYFDTHENGDLLSRVTNDVDTIAQNLNNSLSTLVSSVTLFIGSIFMMFITNWIMAITAIVASLLGFSMMFLLLGKSQKYFSKRQEELGNLNGYIEEIYSGHNVVKVYNGTKSSINEFDNLNKRLYEANRKSVFLSGLMQPIMGFVGDLGYVAVCIAGALLTMNGHISFGVIVAFIVYVRLFTSPLSQIAQAITNLQSTAAASERVFEFLDEVEMSDQTHLTKYLEPTKVEGNMEFKHVQFGYDASRNIIHDFSVSVKKGQKIAIVGPTGAGKTTLVNLLMKFYEINGGDILIDGVSVSELTRENIHTLFCMVLQDTWLFDGSIKENIQFNKENVTEEKIWEACRAVGVEHFIRTLPGGLNALVGDSDTISQGQKQLFTIARGLLEDAPFLILDEATSNVDTRTEELVQQAMDKLMVGKTSFIIAHRLSTIKNADLILVMNEGNIIELGTHDELMKQKGFYEKLYNSQFENNLG